MKYNKAKWSLLFATLFSVFALTYETASALSINQDGFGSSGAVRGFSLGVDVKIQGYGDFGIFGKGENFYSAVFDGTSIWTVGHRDILAKLDRSTGIVTQYKYDQPTNSNMGNVNSLSGNVFCGGVFDGTYLWLIPQNADSIIRVDPATGTMNGYPLAGGVNMGSAQGTNDGKFDGATFDGKSIWMAPFHSDRVVQFDITTHQFVGYAIPPNIAVSGSGLTGSYKFVGAIFSPGAVWLAPYSSNVVVKVNTADGTMASYSMKEYTNGNSNMGNLGTSNPIDNAFQGGGFDGKYVWFTPSKADRLIRLDPETGTMTGFKPGYADIPDHKGSLFSGAAFDGRNLWLCPDKPDFQTSQDIAILMKFDTVTETFTGYPMTENGTTRINTGNYGIASSGHGAVFDGVNIWMAPFNSNRLIKVSPTTFTYHVEYYQDTLDPANLIEDIPGQTHFPEGTTLTYEDVETDLGVDWENAYQPRFYTAGQVQGYPTITFDQLNNVVKVLYEPVQLLHAYTVKYYENYPHGDELIARERSPLVYTESSIIDAATIENDLGADWINQYKPATNFEDGVVKTPLPILVARDPRENEIKVVYDQIAREPVYSFRVDYYKDNLNPTSKISSVPPHVAVGLYEGTQLTREMIDKAYIGDWGNYFRPDGYSEGEVRAYPIISPDPENNAVKVLYEEPKYPYHVQYFIGESTTPIEELNGEDHLVGTQITEEIATSELGEDWIKRFNPDGENLVAQIENYPGSINGYPVITADHQNNVIKMRYISTTPGITPVTPSGPGGANSGGPSIISPETGSINSTPWLIISTISSGFMMMIRKPRNKKLI